MVTDHAYVKGLLSLKRIILWGKKIPYEKVRVSRRDFDPVSGRAFYNSSLLVNVSWVGGGLLLARRTGEPCG